MSSDKSAVATQKREAEDDASTIAASTDNGKSTTAEKKQEQQQEEPQAKKVKMEATIRCILRFAKLTENAYDPVRASRRAAGLDLRSAYDVVIPAHGRALAKTDLQVQVPEGSYGRIAPRSGLAIKNFIDVGAGVVDEDYRGNLGVVLFNHSDTDFEIKRGDRIAQFICERIFYPDLEQMPELEPTERGAGGFGSTGMNELQNGEKMDVDHSKTNGDDPEAAAREKKRDDKDKDKNGDGDSGADKENQRDAATTA